MSQGPGASRHLVSSPHTVAKVECPVCLSTACPAVLPTDTVTPPELCEEGWQGVHIAHLTPAAWTPLPSWKGKLSRPRPPLSSSCGSSSSVCCVHRPRLSSAHHFSWRVPSHASMTSCMSPPDMWEWEELFMCPKGPVESQRCLCQPFTATSYLLGLGHGKAARSVAGSPVLNS